jgi:deazaflavin-dependent oxidoreductase (nitroreductase family)
MVATSAPVREVRAEPAAGVPAPGTKTQPPVLAGPARAASDLSREIFRIGNRTLMVPAHRAGLAAWLGNPLSGWQCLLTTTGRRSGLRRHTPLGYIVMDGATWVMAGYGPRTLWLRNLVEDPRVQLRLPGRPAMDALAEESEDPATRARVMPALCRSMALPGLMIGCFPLAATDARILECVSWVPLVRIRPADGSAFVPGPDDPGGHGWVWRQAIAVGGTLLLVRTVGRLFSGRRHGR